MILHDVKRRLQHVDAAKVNVLVGELDEIADEIVVVMGRLRELGAAPAASPDAMEVSVPRPAAEEEDTRNVVRHCPKTGCLGMLSHWRCVACTARVCHMCEEERTDEEHTCNPEIRASVRVKRAESKPRPSAAPMCRSRWAAI